MQKQLFSREEVIALLMQAQDEISGGKSCGCLNSKIWGSEETAVKALERFEEQEEELYASS